LVEQGGLAPLSGQQYKQLLVIQELFRQQDQVYQTKSHRVEDRIVSIQQPHVRPIVRGKAKANVEFGAKLTVSVVNGYTTVDEVRWDNFNEAGTLPAAVEAYVERHGTYPEAVLADQIYRNRENRQYCKERGIRLSGPKLVRPSKSDQGEHKQLEKQDAAERNEVEGKFGVGKRKYGLSLIQARLPQTSESVIALQFIVMNLEHHLRTPFYSFFNLFFTTGSFLRRQSS
jgi:hypothetical protein